MLSIFRFVDSECAPSAKSFAQIYDIKECLASLLLFFNWHATKYTIKREDGKRSKKNQKARETAHSVERNENVFDATVFVWNGK